MTTINLIHGECLKEMDKLIKQGVTVDAIITDPPYGTTACKWDSVIPFEAMWERLNKLIKSNGAVVLFGSEPFSSALRMSNIKNYKYDWIWRKKKFNSGFVHAKNAPLKKHENISVFSFGAVAHKSQSKKRMEYFPQGLRRCSKIRKTRKEYREEEEAVSFGKRPSHRDTTQEFTNYPQSILEFDLEQKGKLEQPEHPTQKPVALMEYLIKTYTNEDETVLDFTMGSGTTGVACKNTNRNFIGIEMDDKYFKIAQERVSENEIKQATGELFTSEWGLV